MFSKFARTASILSAAALLFAFAPIALAGTVFSTGFEPPVYSLGPLTGQNGWQLFGPGVPTVENFNVKSGTQAVVINASANETGAFHADHATGMVSLSADIFLASSSNESDWQFAGLGPNLAPFIGGVDINGNDIAAITAGFPVVGALSRDAWNNINLIFDFATQTYAIQLNGATIDSNVAFCNDNTTCTTSGTISSFETGFFSSFGDVNANDSGFIDNYNLSTIPQGVPEPGTLALILPGIAGIMGVARRRFYGR